MVIDKVPFFQDANITDMDNIDYGNVRARYIAISPDQWDIVMVPEASRQLGDPNKEVMVVKDGNVIVIDAEKEAEYLENGWALAESIDEATEQGRPHGAPHIENIRFWDLPENQLRFIIKDAKEAMAANPEAEKAITGPGNWADQVNDAYTVLGWRKRNPKREAKRKAERQGIMSKFAEDINGIYHKGNKIKVPWKGKLRAGKVVRYVPQRGSASPYYVVYIGEYQPELDVARSIEVPAHQVELYNEDLELNEKIKGITIEKDGETKRIEDTEWMRNHWIKKKGWQLVKEGDDLSERVTGPTRMQVQNHFDKLSGMTRAKIRDTEQSLNIFDLRIGANGAVLSFKTGTKKVTEGYEKEVLLILKGAGIDGYFSDGILYVDWADELDAKQLVNSNPNILKAPKIIGEDTPSAVKKAGRRVAGSWGRPGSKKQKRAASKSGRQWDPNDHDSEDDNSEGKLTAEGPYAIVWHGQHLEWYGDGDPSEGEGRYKPKGDAGQVLAKNIPTYAIAQKLLPTTAKMSNVGDYGDYGKDGSLVTNSSGPEIIPMSELGKHFYGYNPASQEYGAKPEHDDHNKVMDLKTKMIDVNNPEVGYVENTARAWENYKNTPQKKIEEISSIDMGKHVAQKELDYEEPAYKYEERPRIVGKLKNGMRVGIISEVDNEITVVLYGKQKKALPVGTITLFKYGKGYISSYSKITSKYQGRGLGLELYKFIIEKLGILLISDMSQTPGSQKVWVKLAQTPGIYVYGRRTSPGLKTQFFQVEPDSFNQLSGELEVYDQWASSNSEEQIRIDLKDYRKSIDNMIEKGEIGITKGKQMYEKERVATNKEIRELRKARGDTVLIASATKPPAKGFIDLTAPKNEGKLSEKAPPGREDQVKALKGKVKNPYAVAWASYKKSKKKKGKM